MLQREVPNETPFNARIVRLLSLEAASYKLRPTLGDAKSFDQRSVLHFMSLSKTLSLAVANYL